MEKEFTADGDKRAHEGRMRAYEVRPHILLASEMIAEVLTKRVPQA